VRYPHDLKAHPLVNQAMLRLFRLFDVDGNGSVSAAELRVGFSKSGYYPPPADVERLIKECDTVLFVGARMVLFLQL
jgi:Ca2+-binding EF-hand superfamily protein